MGNAKQTMDKTRYAKSQHDKYIMSMWNVRWTLCRASMTIAIVLRIRPMEANVRPTGPSSQYLNLKEMELGCWISIIIIGRVLRLRWNTHYSNSMAVLTAYFPVLA